MKLTDFIPIDAGMREFLDHKDSGKAIEVSEIDEQSISRIKIDISKTLELINKAIREKMLIVSSRGDLVLIEGGFYDKANAIYVTDMVDIEYTVSGEAQ